MTLLDRPAGSADERVVEVVLLRLGHERAPGVGLKWRNAPLSDGFRPVTESFEELVDIELRHVSSRSDRLTLTPAP